MKRQSRLNKGTENPKSGGNRRAAPQTNVISRRWCFTLYPEHLPLLFFHLGGLNDGAISGKSGEELLRIFKFTDFNSLLLGLRNIRGVFYCLEEGDSKEHPHLQGYLELHAPCRFRALKDMIGFPEIHIEPARGSREENEEYIFHTGKHKDKGKKIRAEKIGYFPKHSGHEKGAYDEAVSLILDGFSVTYVLRLFGGSVLTQVSNLSRLSEHVQRTLFEQKQPLQQPEMRSLPQRADDDDDIPF